MKTSEVLRKAGDVLRRQGFGQGLESDHGNGPICLRGAIGKAGKRSPYRDDHIGYLGMITTGTEDGIVGWNDLPSRTQAEAEAALDAAYVLALQEEGEDPADYEVL